MSFLPTAVIGLKRANALGQCLSVLAKLLIVLQAALGVPSDACQTEPERRATILTFAPGEISTTVEKLVEKP